MSHEDFIKDCIDKSLKCPVFICDWLAHLQKHEIEVIPGNIDSNNVRFSGCSFLYNGEKYVANKLGKRYSAPSLIKSGLIYEQNKDKKILEDLYCKHQKTNQNLFLKKLSHSGDLPKNIDFKKIPILKSVYEVNGIVKISGKKANIKYYSLFDNNNLYSQMAISSLSPSCIQMKEVLIDDISLNLDYADKNAKKPCSIQIKSNLNDFDDICINGEGCVSYALSIAPLEYKSSLKNLFMLNFDSKMYSAHQIFLDILSGDEFFRIERYIDAINYDFCLIKPTFLEI